jgi:hypothetical protein
MNNQQSDLNDEEPMKELDEIIRKKKEEIAGLQRLLRSIENPTVSDSDQPISPEEKRNNSESGE